jgi:hypothetical protein
MIDAITNNMTMIATCIYMFLIGVGIGAAITDKINSWGSEANNEHIQ